MEDIKRLKLLFYILFVQLLKNNEKLKVKFYLNKKIKI